MDLSVSAGVVDEIADEHDQSAAFEIAQPSRAGWRRRSFRRSAGLWSSPESSGAGARRGKRGGRIRPGFAPKAKGRPRPVALIIR